MNVAQPSPLLRAPLEAIPRDYNFAADILKRNLDAGRAGKLAYIDQRQGSTDQGWTYGDLAGRVERFGHVLRSLGLRREERVLLCLVDTIDWPTAFLGAIKAGMVPVPVNTLLTEDDYRFMLEDSRARLLVVSDELYPKFAKAVAASAEPPHVDRVGRQHPRARPIRGPARRRHRRPGDGADGARRHVLLALYVRFDRQAQGRRPHPCRPEAHRRVSTASPILGITENDVCFSVAKLFFAYGLGNALTFPMSAGATTVLLAQRPTPEAVADILKKHRVTVFYAVPTFYAGFLASAAAPERDEVEAALLRFGRRSAAVGCRPPL